MNEFSYNIDVVMPEEFQEFFDTLFESLPSMDSCEVRLSPDAACFYVSPSEDYEYSLTPCLPTLEDLVDWLMHNEEQFFKNYRNFEEGGW